MLSGSPLSRAVVVLSLALQFSAVWCSRADIVINEVVAGASDRLLQWDNNGVPKLGAGTPWQAPGFNDTSWQTGTAPFGFGSFSGTTAVINTNVSAQMLNLTPTFYLRKTFTVSAADAASTNAVTFNVTYNDGFVCYLNGVEIGRRWAGPANEFIYHDQPAYNPTSNLATNPATQYTASITLSSVNAKLLAGANVLAVQALNWSVGSTNFLVAPSLQMSGGTTFVSSSDTWKYFPGIVEPSGAFYDPSLLGSGRLNVAWGGVNYDDSTWTAAVSPLRVGQTGTGTIIPTANVIGVASSVYSRTVFTATAAQVADTQPMQFLVDYDDAFIAYINGVEVARANVGVANTFTPYNAVASATHNNTGTEITYVIDPPASLLVAGNNVLSVQLHNVALNDPDMSLRFDLKTTGGTFLMTSGAACKYFIGTSEPVGTGGSGGLTDYGDTPDAPDSAVDWVELYNNGTAAVSLNGWSMTDNSKSPTQWLFPNVSIPAGGYLVVICDGLNVTAPAANGYLHTNFSLAKEGEFLGLYNASGAVVQTFSPALPPAQPFYSYARDTNGSYGFFDTPTPGAANAGTEYTAAAAAPVISAAGGFYTFSQTVLITTATSGASIRYTTDGSEPTTTNGTLYTGQINISASVPLRARAFAPGLTPSSITTTTFLIGQSAALQSLPALCITADQGRTLYRPDGVMAIVNNLSGNYSGGLWTANNDPTEYNNPSLSGRDIERAATLEILYPGTPPAGYSNVKTDFGLRITGSDYTAPRFLLTAQNATSNPNLGTWTDPNSSDTSTQKPSFDLYFRSDFGLSPLVAPIFPGSPITSFHDIRLRAGHNDPNPFVQDEFVRRLWVSMGQVGSMGILTSLYVDGVYKGYYNLCEHLREDFFQQSYNSTKDWDVRQVTDIASGDGIAFQDMITFVRTYSPATLANYQAMQAKLDMTNFCDYLLLNAFCASQDWPTNNYIVSREHSSTGIHRYHVWDAEQTFGYYTGNVTTNSFTAIAQPIYESNAASDTNLTDSIRILYSLLKLSPEFRLLFADRAQKHLFNNGALTPTNILGKWNVLKTQITPFLPSVTDRVTPWVNGTSSLPSRQQALFGYTSNGSAVQGHLVAEGLWPATSAPTLSQFGGAITSGYQLTLTNPNVAGTIYYTLDGSDPRAVAGDLHGTAYAGAITLTQTTEVKARVLNNGDWSPVSDAIFTVSTPPALAITELMYHPPLTGTNTAENEFIEIKNTGSTTVSLSGMSFTSGITYTFPAGSTLAAGAFAVLVKDAAQFAARYPNVPVAGVFTDSLSNSGETITLADLTGTSVYSVTYSNLSPWPVLADGYGNSLVPVSANSNPDPNNPVNWRASSAIGGSPGADDPTPTTPAILVNEVLANSLAPQTDTVELYNPTSAAADISGWYLSDSTTTPLKFKIPAGTVIAPGGYQVYTEADFNPTPGVGTSFAFDANGEQVRLTAADGNGNVTGYSDGFSFGASAPGVSFGRYVNSVGAVSYPAQKAQTFGAANAGPLVGPVVLTELMYHPATASLDEFLEIRNISNGTVALYDPANPANTWKVDGVGFNFPTGTTIAPGQIFLVVPLTEAAWRAKYNPPAAVRVFGAYTGKQDNSGERISLQKPGVPYTDPTTNTTVIPYIDVDYVNYLPTAPWPVAANGTGPSLERLNPTSFGDDPGNWRASPASGGSPGALPVFTYTTWNSAHFTAAQLANTGVSGPNADPDGDGIPNLLEYALGLDPLIDNALPYSSSLSMDGTSGPYITLTYRRSTSTSGLTFSGDTTGNLTGAWTLGGAVQIGAPVNDGDGTETVILRDTIPSTSTTQRFIRLHVTSN